MVNARKRISKTTLQNKNVRFYQKRNFKKNLFVFSLLIWPILHFLVFWVYVNGRTFLLMFQSFDRYGTITGKPMTYYFVGFRKFAQIIRYFFASPENGGDILLRRALLNSLSALPLNVCVILPIAFISSYVLFKRIKGAPFFRVVFYLPSIISIVVLTMQYKYMFDNRFGPLYRLIKLLFGYAPESYFGVVTHSDTIWPLIYIYCVWAGLGMNVILLSGAMARIPTEILEYGKLDGIGFWRECFQVVLPLIWPTVSTLIVLGTMSVFGFTMQPYLLAGPGGGYNGQTMTISLYIFTIITENYSQQLASQAATIGTVFSVLGIPFVFLIKHFTEKLWADVEF